MPCILIDNEVLCFLKATPTIQQAEYWAEILAPSHDFLITGDETRNYSCYTHYELRTLFHKTTGTAVPEDIDYGKLVKGVAELARNLIVDETSLDDLKAKLGRELSPQSPLPAPDKPSKVKPPTSSTGGSRPKAGSTTGRVWEIADDVLAHVPDLINDAKGFREAVIKRCVEAGINPATASTQFGKWKKHQNS